jgi:hypothetical protein
MPQDWFAQQAASAHTSEEKDWFAAQAPPAADAPSGVGGALSEFGGGVKEGLGGLLDMVRHPIDTATAFGSGIVEAGKAIPDVVRLLADDETRMATARGFVEGAAEGATGASIDEAKKSPFRAAGRFTGGVVVPAVALKGAPKLARIARGKPPVVTPAATRVTGTGAPAGAVQVPAQPLGQIRMNVPMTPEAPPAVAVPPKGANLVKQPERPALAPPNTNVNAAIEQALSEIQNPPPATPPTARIRKAPPATELPESWKALVKDPDAPTSSGGVDIQAQPGMGLDPNVVRTFRQSIDGGDLGDARRAVGSEKAAVNLDAIAAEIGVDRSVMQQMIRDTTDGPSRRPMAAELAEMDTNYLRRINDPRGAIDPRLALTTGATVAGGLGGAALAEDTNPIAGGILGALAGAAVTNPATALKAAQTARMTAMLSGAAVPKSMAGNAGAFLTAAAERGSTAPLMEAARLPTNLKNLAQGWKHQANPAGIGGMGRVNVFGRAMGAMDEMTTQALQRAGLTLEEAQRLLLTAPNPLGNGRVANILNTPTGRALVPFQRTPFNGFAEGVQSINELAPGSGAGAARRGLTLGAGAAGAVAGEQTDNPLLLALLAAFAGPRALPFAAGAGLTAGPQVIERVGVGLPEGSIRDLLEPWRPINKPAFLKLLETGGR